MPVTAIFIEFLRLLATNEWTFSQRLSHGYCLE